MKRGIIEERDGEGMDAWGCRGGKKRACWGGKGRRGERKREMVEWTPLHLKLDRINEL